jgi:hypothetical protein
VVSVAADRGSPSGTVEASCVTGSQREGHPAETPGDVFSSKLLCWRCGGSRGMVAGASPPTSDFHLSRLPQRV